MLGQESDLTFLNAVQQPWNDHAAASDFEPGDIGNMAGHVDVFDFPVADLDLDFWSMPPMVRPFIVGCDSDYANNWFRTRSSGSTAMIC
jgi:hypothetical protein